MLTDSVARIIAKNGQAFTVQRRTIAAGANAWTAGATTAAYMSCTAFEREYPAKEIRGGIVQGDLEITIDAATCSAAPMAGDRIAPGTFSSDVGAAWRQVVTVQALTEAGVARVYKVQARK